MDVSNELASLQSTDLDAGLVFSGKPSGTMVRGYAIASAVARHVKMTHQNGK